MILRASKLHEEVALRLGKPSRQLLLERAPVTSQSLGRIRRGRRTHIGREISEAFIDLVTNPSYHWDFADSNRARQPLIIKSGKIISTTATAYYCDHVYFVLLVQKIQGSYDLYWRLYTLDLSVYR